MECKLRCVNFWRVSDPRRAFRPAFRVTGMSDDRYSSSRGVIVIGLGTPWSANHKPGSTWERWRQAWERRQQLWEHLASQYSSLRKTTSSLGALLLLLEMIATTYRSTMFKTHVFGYYPHLSIYVSILLPIYTRHIWTGCRRCFRGIRGAPENDDQVNSEIHSEALIKRVWRCTWRW